MDDIVITDSLNDYLNRSFKTICEMIDDRNIEENYLKNITNNELNEFLKNNENYIEMKINKDMLLLYYFQKVDSKNIEIIQKIINNFSKDSDVKVILVTKDKIKSNNLKNIKEFSNNIEIFNIKELLFNVYKHELVPKHEPITDKDEINNLIKKYKLRNIHQFPLIMSKDPICKYLNIPKNVLIKITRPSITSGEYIIYRCVV
jgi:DNA-directed RNA polymerase I, II, and III subunit RPABC1